MTRDRFIHHVECCQKEFRRFLTALCCGDSSLADDIAQDAFLKAYLCCDNFNDDNKFKAWVFRIGYTTFISHMRAERPATSYDSAAGIQSADLSDSGFRYQDLYASLNMLPAKERTSVLLFYMEGYSIKEIAEIEQTSPDAVKQHLSRGRKHLRALMTNT